MLIAKNLMKDGVLPLKTSDTGREGLESMEDYRVMHLPIVNNLALLGLISEFDILTSNVGWVNVGLYSGVDGWV